MRNRSLLVFASPSAKISEYSKGRKKENKKKKIKEKHQLQKLRHARFPLSVLDIDHQKTYLWDVKLVTQPCSGGGGVGCGMQEKKGS